MWRCNHKNCDKIAIARSKSYNIGERHYYCVYHYVKWRIWRRQAIKRMKKLREYILTGQMDKAQRGEW